MTATRRAGRASPKKDVPEQCKRIMRDAEGLVAALIFLPVYLGYLKLCQAAGFSIGRFLISRGVLK